MRPFVALVSCLFLASITLHAESKNPADYPLRLHVFGKNETTFYHNRSLEESKGEGRANLFANGEVHAIDFTFDCSEKLKSSFGYETYPAKWKKPNQELTVLLPVFGKANTFFTCNIKTDVKDFAYIAHDGKMSSEPPAEFKAWMIKHDYDPEHDKNTPTRPEPKSAAAQPAAAPPQ
jgi:hypothetical protein